MTTVSRSAGDAYAIRQYRPGDREGYLSLYERVFGERREEQFEWRFADNPYVDETPICVAVRDGDIVGARSSLVFPLRVGGESVSTIVQVDPMVHPDHRGRGLFVRMVEHVYGHYADREPAVSIGFPNEAVIGGLRKVASKLSLDAGFVDTFPQYYRVQRPAALVDEDAGARTRVLGRLVATPARGYLAVRDRLAGSASNLTVERHESVPAGRLAALAARHAPSRAHARRDEQFYRWRFANPRYDYSAYVASRDGAPVAALVAGTRTDDATTVTHVSDAIPLAGGRSRDAALSQLLSHLVADHRDSDLLAAAGDAVPESVLAAHGFHDNTSFPLSRVTMRNYLAVRPVTSGDVAGWSLGGRRLSEPGSWLLSFCEREIG